MSIKIMSQVWENGPEDKSELVVMLALADFANDEGECWPSMESIGKKARMSDRNARRVLRKLEADGYVETAEGRGRHGGNRYVIKPDRMSGRTECPGGQNVQENRTKRAGKPDIAMSAKPSRTIKNHQIYRSTPEKPTTQKKPTRQSAFDEFWSAYPMKVGKVAARRNFDRAVKAGADPGEIIAGVKRYAVSENVRRGFIKHPRGWLTDGRWADEAQPPIPQQSEATTDRQSFLRKIAGASP